MDSALSQPETDGPDGGDVPGQAPMAERSPMDDLPPELLMEILSRLTLRQQLGVRSVSRRWQEAVDACIATRRELHLCVNGYRHDILDDVMNLLQAMSALRRLWLRIEYCQLRLKSSEIGITAVSALNSASVGMLCASCPQLQEVRLDCSLCEDGVRTLLSCLPGLRVLHLPRFSIGGDLLSLLPAGLQSLAVRGRDHREFRHLIRCPQLRELHLYDVYNWELKIALAACPQLERLAVEYFDPETLDWAGLLTLCPKLWELNVESGTPCLPGMVFPGDLLERMAIHETIDQPSTLVSARQHHQFNLSRLDVSSVFMDNTLFCELTRLLPSLSYLKLSDVGKKLTEEGVASGLRNLMGLQVLQLDIEFTLRRATPVLASLSDLPLKAFSCVTRFSNRVAACVLFIAAVLRRCPTLSVLRLPDCAPAWLRSFVKDLRSIPSAEVTLLLPRELVCELPRLPASIRVVEDKLGVWGELTGWCSWESSLSWFCGEDICY